MAHFPQIPTVRWCSLNGVTQYKLVQVCGTSYAGKRGAHTLWHTISCGTNSCGDYILILIHGPLYAHTYGHFGQITLCPCTEQTHSVLFKMPIRLKHVFAECIYPVHIN